MTFIYIAVIRQFKSYLFVSPLCCSWNSVVVFVFIHHTQMYDSKSPAVCHVEGRSSPEVVQWRPLDCVSYFWRKSHVVPDDFDSKSSDTPDRTWWLCFCLQYRRHTPHLQIQCNTEQDELVVLSSWVSPPLQPAWCFSLKQVL